MSCAKCMTFKSRKRHKYWAVGKQYDPEIKDNYFCFESARKDAKVEIMSTERQKPIHLVLDETKEKFRNRKNIHALRIPTYAVHITQLTSI